MSGSRKKKTGKSNNADESKANANAGRRRLLAITGVATLAAVAAATALILISQAENGSSKASEGAVARGGAEAKAMLSGLDQRGSEVGDPKAKVVLVEYGDLRCPVCRLWAERAYPQIIEQVVRPGVARFRFTNNAILGPESELAARANVAAARQNKGMLFADVFYRNQQNELQPYVNMPFLESVARASGLEMEAFTSSMRSPVTAARVAEQRDSATEIGIIETPRFVIEGPAGAQVLSNRATPEQVIEATKAAARDGR